MQTLVSSFSAQHASSSVQRASSPRKRSSRSSLMEQAVSLSLAVFCCLSLLVATERQAHAYIDPGSGLLALQSIASMLAAAAYFLRRRIALLFSRSKNRKPAASVVLSQSMASSLQKDDTRSAA